MVQYRQPLLKAFQSEISFAMLANYNCFQITLLCRAATHFIQHTLNLNNGIVYPPRCLKRR
jgi:hypothetical protein